MTGGRLLIVDDEKIAVNNLAHVMRKEGYEVTTATSGAAALRLMAEQGFEVILTDLRMSRIDGMDILESVRRQATDTEVIIITGFSTLESAVEAMKRGAYSYIAKPFRLEEVRRVTAEAVAKVERGREDRRLKQEVVGRRDEGGIITRDGRMHRLIETVRQVSPTDCTVLITGESGVGKELFAHFVHETSRRARGPFVAVNCSAFNEGVLENELFGHGRGAFTGAGGEHKGLIESANGGTLFFDEIAEMSTSMQVKLLRVIQEREVRRLGEVINHEVDVRFVGATNRDLAEEVRQGRFRQDLYYRLNVAHVAIPPLVERRGDIPLLCHHFLDQFARQFQKKVTGIEPRAMELLMAYDYPGNVRELRNIIERGVALATGELFLESHLPNALVEVPIHAPRLPDGRLPTLEEREKAYILWVMQHEARGNQTLAASILGIDRVSLWRKLKKYQSEGE
ncbi:MAG: sigma-54-dependent Fis family transcriptional regulator [Magnetococcales bacterium]|nr:sigma-54-dependent Fis family transcriptional regulator [Magnetococcales bacterium]MBF0156147.1 sigma-54-dependent Fis family transcriptional regulator [Magnetococcales bacterium]